MLFADVLPHGKSACIVDPEPQMPVCVDRIIAIKHVPVTFALWNPPSIFSVLDFPIVAT
jgi:hypothetical protein